MAKVSTKRRNNDFEEADKGILAHFGLDDDASDKDKDDNKGKSDDMQALRDQISEMQRNMEQMQRTNMALLSQPMQTPRVEQLTRPQEQDFGDLPDPTLDREAFDKALRDRVNSMVTQQVQAVKGTLDTARAQEKAADDLWADFSTKHDAYSEDQDKVEFAATKVVSEMKARGVDVQKYMFQARDQFFKDVTAKYDTMFGKPGAEQVEQDEQEDEDTQRTAGIFGGLESGGAPAKGKQESPGDMIKDLHDLQRKSGFF